MLKKTKRIMKKKMEKTVRKSIENQEAMASDDSPTILGHWFYELEKPKIKK
ncbi:hypothetical protein [Enterococcus diestrammenae]|jgi:hypothetical protein|uniref:Cyclic lactone autoinducer peptide n=1 Tax=Enterococcus diestrammenae TaxID=1155073 RepID=A0ABV0F0B7_9ENTE|nr:hypothetical protein [Enterococcus diestrammenae]